MLAARGAHGATMAEIAVASGVAKATLYNHFRTRADIYASLAAREVDTLAGLLADAGSLDDGLHEAAEWLATHPVVRAIVGGEPELVSWFACPDRAPALWSIVRDALRELAGRTDGDVSVDAAMRWLASFATAPGSPSDRSSYWLKGPLKR